MSCLSCRREPWSAALVLSSLVAVCTAAVGQDNPSTSPLDPAVVAATIENENITLGEVERLVAQQMRGQSLSPAAQSAARAAALQQLIHQVLVLRYLREQQLALSDDELQLESERWQAKLEAVGQTLPQFLAAENLSESAWRRELHYRRSWQRYLESMLTAENLHKHFERFRRELDGTRLHVQHLLLAANQESDRGALRTTAAKIGNDIRGGRLTWADAVAKFSQAPSAAEEGELGWIERDAPMPEPFSQAAYQLQPHEISPPVETRFGVHLIRCLAVEPGTKPEREVEPATRRHATRYLFDWIVARQRGEVRIEYSGACPHWDADGRLVEQ